MIAVLDLGDESDVGLYSVSVCCLMVFVVFDLGDESDAGFCQLVVVFCCRSVLG